MKREHNNRKANIFLPTMAVLAVYLWASMWMTTAGDNFEGKDDYQIGQRQIELFNTYAEGELLSIYIEEKVSQNLPIATQKVFQEGGHDSQEPCGTEETTYSVWQTNSQECYPQYKRSLEQNLENIMKDQINPSHYKFSLTDKQIIGTPLTETELTLTGNNQNEVGIYYPDMSISRDVPTDLTIFEETINAAKSLYDACLDPNCVQAQIQSSDRAWETKVEGNRVYIDVETDTTSTIWNSETDTFVDEKLTLKFALDFS